MALSGRRIGAALAGAVAACAVAAPAASAVAYEPAPPFCEETELRNFLRPLERLPKLRSPPSSSGLLGSANVRLHFPPSLLVRYGTLGFSLHLDNYSGPPAHPGWRIATTVSKIDWNGRATKVLHRSSQVVHAVGRDSSPGVSVEAEAPGAYRVSLVIRNRGGKALGRFGYYARLVAPTKKARLALNGTSFPHGGTVFARIENLGTVTVFFGTPWRLEVLNGGAWTVAPESPRGVWLAIGLHAPPGGTGSRGCAAAFGIPATTVPGRYRIVKSIDYVIPYVPGAKHHPLRRDDIELYAEFDVLPY